MKRTFVVLALLLVLCAGFAFADGVSIGAWGRGIWCPVADGNLMGTGVDKMTSSVGPSWAMGMAASPRVGFTVSGSSENVGFIVAISADGSIGLNEEASIWVKPLPGMTVSVGRKYDDTLRGNAGFGSYNWARNCGVAQFGDDFVFSRAGAQYGSSVNSMITYSIAGAFIYVNEIFNGLTYFGDTTANGKGDPINNISAGVGYTVEGIGTFRVQRVSGSWMAWNNAGTDGTIEAAAKITAVPSLLVDLGVKYYYSDKRSAGADQIIVPLYANYKMGGLGLNLGFQLAMTNTLSGATAKTKLMAALGADYDLGGGLGVEGDVRFEDKNNAGLVSKDFVLSFMAGVKKGFSNGLIGLGLEVKTTDGDKINFELPVRLEYWF